MFLFQIGAIRRVSVYLKGKKAEEGFYSKLVRLEVDAVRNEAHQMRFLFQIGAIRRGIAFSRGIDVLDRVSIPNWCD